MRPAVARCPARPGSDLTDRRNLELMSIRRLIPLLAAVLIATGAVLPRSEAPVRANDPNVNDAIAQQQQMEAELARQRASLGALRRTEASLAQSLQRISGDLQQVGLEIQAARAELDRVTAELEAARAELARYREQIAKLEADLEVVAADIEQTKVDLAARVQLLEEHLRVAYEQSRVSLLEVLLSVESLGDAAGQLGYMLTLSDEDRRLAGEIRETREQLRVRRQTLREGRVVLRELEEATAAREQSLAEQQAQVDALRAELERKEAQLEQIKAEQEAQLAATIRTQEQKAALIAQQERALAAQAALVERLKEQARQLDAAYRGRFAWPERGSFVITQEFGHTSFNHAHTGIDMSYTGTRCSGPIYAAGDGVVLADGRPAAPGDTAIGVIVGHSQRLQTWYWHLSSEIVSQGQRVTTGQLIGYEGSTGWSTGCHLHFEVRLDGIPVNPRLYLP